MNYWFRTLSLAVCLTALPLVAADQPAPAATPAPAPAATPAPEAPAATAPIGPVAPGSQVPTTPPPAATGTTPPPATTTGGPKTTGTATSTTDVSGTPATAEAHPPATLMDSLGTLIPMLAIFGFFFYFMLIRPEQRRRKEHDNMISTIKKGAQVLTASGLFGTVQDVQGDAVLVMIDEKNKVVVKMQKSYVQAVVGASGQPITADKK